MIYYINTSKDAAFNLALEEVLAFDDNLTDEILLLWQNDNSIIIGRNQNTIEEINNDAVKKYQVNVVRRLSGGGAVYHDKGNLNYTFISNKGKNNLRNYESFTKPIITVLHKLGLNAQFSGKNDIVIDEKKISGNAQFVAKGKTNERIVHHGTILFDVNLDFLPLVLKPDLQKLASKGIKSIKARVTNIAPLLKQKISITDFKELIIQELVQTKQGHVLTLPEEIIIKAEEIANKKYRTWAWNYGQSPAFNLENKTRYENKGTIDVRINIENGLIKDIKFFGDFLGANGTETIEKTLINQPYRSDLLSSLLTEQLISETFGDMFNQNEIIHAIIR